MNGADEANVASDGIVLTMKETTRSNLKETEDEHVSSAHRATQDTGDGGVLPVRTVHANEPVQVPSGWQAEQIKEFVDIARKTNQASKIMNFPPIDHDSAVS